MFRFAKASFAKHEISWNKEHFPVKYETRYAWNSRVSTLDPISPWQATLTVSPTPPPPPPVLAAHPGKEEHEHDTPAWLLPAITWQLLFHTSPLLHPHHTHTRARTSTMSTLILFVKNKQIKKSVSLRCYNNPRRVNNSGRFTRCSSKEELCSNSLV